MRALIILTASRTPPQETLYAYALRSRCYHANVRIYDIYGRHQCHIVCSHTAIHTSIFYVLSLKTTP